MKSKESIFILVQSGYSARNFILSGFLNQNKGSVTFWSDQNYIDQYNIDNNLIKLPEKKYSGKLNLLQIVKNKAEIFFYVRKFKNKNYKSYLIKNIKTTTLKGKIKNYLTNIFGTIFSTEKGIEYLDIPFNRTTRKTTYYKKCKEQLLKHKPTIVFCTHQRVSSGVAPMLAARDLGIKTVCFIHSWDNIPKGVQLIKADTYFVWSDYMKKEMLSHYPFIKNNHIKVTGTPQFIPHLDKKYRLPREEFFNEFQLDLNKKYILFSGNDKTSSPNEAAYLKDLCKAVIKLNEVKDDYRIVFRPNPIDKNEDFDLVLKEYSILITEIKPNWFGSDVFIWNKGGPSEKDITLLVNTILHSELIVNVGSTMALDAALLNKASCYINYEVTNKYNWSVRRAYRFIHFNMIKAINPVFWINNRNEVLSVLLDALENPQKTAKGRAKWISTITKLPIEETNIRMWNFLLDSNEV